MHSVKSLLPILLGISLLLLLNACQRTNNSSNTNNGGSTPPTCKAGNGAKDIDGNTYTSVIIGTQEWLGENLTVTRYQNGDAIGNVTDATQWSTTTSGGWRYYNDDVQFNSAYGKLYNWFAVNDLRGIAPSGWHIPSDAEWTTLMNNLGGQMVAGGKLKETGLAHWYLTDSTVVTNSSCFTALAGGRAQSGCTIATSNTCPAFLQITQYGNWWSATDAGSQGASVFNLGANDPNSAGIVHWSPKNFGSSVRCIKN